MIDTIEFDNYKKKNDIYGTAMYPAVMVGPVQKLLLQEVLKGKHSARIMDPFHGSGTALYEAFEINPKYELYGIDINPLANLITKAKLQGVDANIINDIEIIKMHIFNKETSYSIVSFTNINKWFRKDVIEDLSKIKYSIEQISSQKNRVFFWVMMSNIIRKYSNTRSSTYKLHIKKQEQILAIKNNVLSDFINLIEKNYVFYLKASKNYHLIKGDTLKELKLFKDNYFDILITSPPYGDNATTVTYGQFSILILYWINQFDLELDGWEFDNFSKIDRESLGGYGKDNKQEKYNHYIVELMNSIKAEDKKRKVEVFFDDYFSFLDIAYKVTKSFIIMTLGNRTVNGVNIELVDYTKQYLCDLNMELVYEGKRNIYSKRTPKVISLKNGEPIYSMNEEYVIILKK